MTKLFPDDEDDAEVLDAAKLFVDVKLCADDAAGAVATAAKLAAAFDDAAGTAAEAMSSPEDENCGRENER